MSLKDGSFYKGYSYDYLRRFEEHNLGLGRYSSMKKPWKLIYAEECASKKDALIREKSLKKANSDYIRWLICQPSNILK